MSRTSWSRKKERHRRKGYQYSTEYRVNATTQLIQAKSKIRITQDTNLTGWTIQTHSPFWSSPDPPDVDRGWHPDPDPPPKPVKLNALLPSGLSDKLGARSLRVPLDLPPTTGISYRITRYVYKTISKMIRARQGVMLRRARADCYVLVPCCFGKIKINMTMREERKKEMGKRTNSLAAHTSR